MINEYLRLTRDRGDKCETCESWLGGEGPSIARIEEPMCADRRHGAQTQHITDRDGMQDE